MHSQRYTVRQCLKKTEGYLRKLSRPYLKIKISKSVCVMRESGAITK